MLLFKPEKMDVVVLCGGKGERLRELVSDRPKPLAEINQKPFLDILIEHIAQQGFKRFVLCTGYKGDVIKRHYHNYNLNLEFVFSEEEKPLGTGGAVNNAKSFITSDTFMVMNGDSLCPLNYKDFFSFHKQKKALLSIALTTITSGKDYGSVILGERQRVAAFDEKEGGVRKQKFINAGIYLMEKQIFPFMEIGDVFSLERDFFPQMLNNSFYGYITEHPFIDIGTPERFKNAQKILAR